MRRRQCVIDDDNITAARHGMAWLGMAMAAAGCGKGGGGERGMCAMRG